MTAKYMLPQRLVVYVTDGPFTWSEEDSKRRNKFTLGLHAEISVHVVPNKRRFEKELKNGGRQKQKCSLSPSTLFTGVNNFVYNNQLVVTPNEMVGLYRRD